MSGRWPLVLFLVFVTHLPFFAWRWRATRERRYAATTLTFALLVVEELQVELEHVAPRLQLSFAAAHALSGVAPHTAARIPPPRPGGIE